MISILCLEDHTELAQEVEKLASTRFGSNLEFTVAHNVAAANEAVRERVFDIALIDIHVPLLQGDPPSAIGGVRFLEYVLTSARARRPRYLAGITADPHALEIAGPFFASNMFTLIHRDLGSTEWHEQLSKFFAHVENVLDTGHAARPMTKHESDPQPALLVVCALREKELNPLLKAFADTHWTRVEDNDPTSWYRCTLRTHSIVAVAAHEPGMPAAAALTGRMLQKFKPRVVAMTGIAAAVSEDCGYGDILLSEHVWDYTAGKAVSGTLRPEVKSLKCDPVILDQARRLRLDATFLATVQSDWPGPTPDTRLQVHVGPTASGNAVIEDEEQIARVIDRERKTIGLDMEAYGVAIAAWYSERPNPAVLIAKSVVDYGVPPKTDQWHCYAAYTSARFLAEWAKRFL